VIHPARGRIERSAFLFYKNGDEEAIIFSGNFSVGLGTGIISGKYGF